MSDIEALISEFTQNEQSLVNFSKKLHTLVEELVQANSIRVHSVTERVKSRERLRDKLSRRREKKYENLEEITDQIGLRIITYYEDEVDQIAQIIEREFSIDKENSVDKRIQSDPEKFTYSSLHFVCSLSAERKSLREYSRYADIKWEIQIRSMLQHAWAEIEHDWYELQEDLPHEIKRRFSRLAGLLDLADAEFLAIRKQKNQYEKAVAVRVEAEDSDISDVVVDRISMRSFVLQDPLVLELDSKIAQELGGPLDKDTDRLPFSSMLSLVQDLNFKTLQQLKEALALAQDVIMEYIRLCKPLWSNLEPKSVMSGVCILYLTQLLLSDYSSMEIDLLYLNANLKRSPTFQQQLIIADKLRKQSHLERPKNDRPGVVRRLPTLGAFR